MSDVLGGDYPTTWDDFIGQDGAKRILRIAAKSAKMRNAQMAHTLLSSGTPGIGKTSLALLIAQELGTDLKIVSGKVPAKQARIMLSGMSDGDVLFWDEIHMAVQGGKANAEWLLNYLQDGVMMGPMGAEAMPKVIIIGATTDAGKLPETILQRFSIQQLVDYNADEAAMIAFQMAIKVFAGTELPFVSHDNCVAIAAAANHNPRMMRNILINLRDIALCEDMANWNAEAETYDLTEALGFLQLDPDGLDLLARRYLLALIGDFAGGAGERALADRLQEPGGLGMVERVLMAKNLIAKTPQGRVLTSDGIKRANRIKAEQKMAVTA